MKKRGQITVFIILAILLIIGVGLWLSLRSQTGIEGETERIEKVLEEDGTDGGTRRFCISTGEVDRDHDVINPNGWHLDNYRANPVILFAHDYRSLPIAQCPDIKLENGRLMASANVGAGRKSGSLRHSTFRLP